MSRDSASGRVQALAGLGRCVGVALVIDRRGFGAESVRLLTGAGMTGLVNGLLAGAAAGLPAVHRLREILDRVTRRTCERNSATRDADASPRPASNSDA